MNDPDPQPNPQRPDAMAKSGRRPKTLVSSPGMQRGIPGYSCEVARDSVLGVPPTVARDSVLGADIRTQIVPELLRLRSDSCKDKDRPSKDGLGPRDRGR